MKRFKLKWYDPILVLIIIWLFWLFTCQGCKTSGIPIPYDVNESVPK